MLILIDYLSLNLHEKYKSLYDWVEINYLNEMKNTSKQQLTQVKRVSGNETEVKLSDAETIKQAYRVKNKLERQDKIPQKYLEIKAQIKSRINDHAYTYIPRLYETLRKAGFEKEVAKLTVIADGLDFGWTYNTIRKSIPTEAKNQNKAKGAIAASKARNKNKIVRESQRLRTESKIENGNGDGKGRSFTETKTESVQTFILTGQNVLDIYKCVENDLEHVQDARVKIQFENEKLVNASLFR